MSIFTVPNSLPTLDKHAATIPADLDARKVATELGTGYGNMPYLPYVHLPLTKHSMTIPKVPAHMAGVYTSQEGHGRLDGRWHVTVRDGEQKEKIFIVKHLVFATGFGSYRGSLPTYPGMASSPNENFKGQILHSSQHKKAVDHLGKKVVVIGACTSAHDLCADYYENGVDVTMFQRSSTYVMTIKSGWKILMEGLYSENAPPVDIADRLNVSYPNHLFKSAKNPGPR
ncbi:hypothetical protein C8J57DRAFT_1214695 [Mycena rebaudengoi]|nr:hypothetical protein C8J57DRAFT_1214695 [Mycena rebaudengoi]